MLVSQKEQAQKEVERLLSKAQEQTQELAIAKEFAESIAAENAKLYSSEQGRRHAAEALTRASRQLSSLSTEEEVPQQIVTQLSQIIPVERCVLFLGGRCKRRATVARSPWGFRGVALEGLELPRLGGKNVYYAIAKQGEHMLVVDVKNMKGWRQPEWLPQEGSWLGIPLFAKNKVVGLLAMSRKETASFNQDDILHASTLAIQASIALENAWLYDKETSFNQLLGRMVEQHVEELNRAMARLEKLDRNKSDFIQVAAHELRTPLTVIKGYMGMLKAARDQGEPVAYPSHGRRPAGHRPPAPGCQQHAGCRTARKPGAFCLISKT